MLARTFGCARVVFNDAIRCREAAHLAGEKITPTDVQRRVITEAKTTKNRVWLRDVALVPLAAQLEDLFKLRSPHGRHAAGSQIVDLP